MGAGGEEEQPLQRREKGIRIQKQALDRKALAKIGTYLRGQTGLFGRR